MPTSNQKQSKAFRAIFIQLSRSEIERQSTDRALGWLNQFTHSPEVAWASRNSLTLHVSGYDDDPRELYEIPEVCKFFRALHAKWPLWFFFVRQDEEDHTLGVLLSCICGGQKACEGVIEMESDRVQNFVMTCASATNKIFDRWHFPEDENKKIFFGALKQLGWGHGHKR